MQKILALLALLITPCAYTQTISYKLEMPDPQSHYYYVTMTVEGWKKNTLDVKMPVWAPGSYLVREFARGVDYVNATSGGTALKTAKADKSTWRIQTEGKSSVQIKYNVYAFELSVRTSFLDASHGFVSGSSVFMYVPELNISGGTLEVVLPAGFKKISTALKSTGPGQFSYANIDELYDCPLEIGNHLEFDFESAGCRHRVAMYGEGNFEVEKLQKDMARVTAECTKVWGENPNKEYLFIVHNLTVGTGGLEHANSTTLQVNRNTYSAGNYINFLSLVAHEYFHVWNVKRLRPAGLWPYNYDQENYTDLLWVSEGFTSYYEDLVLKRAGFYDEAGYIRALNSTLGSVENQPGSHVQSLAESSFDAWIKGYRPNENSSNTTISYYPKGHLVGALLDIEIINATNGKMKLDNLMQKMYNDFYKVKKQGFTFQDFKNYAETMCGKKLDDFFNTTVLTAGDINYNQYFALAGYSLSVNSKNNEPWLGVQTKDNAGKCVISGVTDGGSGAKGGLNVNDEIIAINGQRVDNNTLGKAVTGYSTGTKLAFLISRDNLVQTVYVTLEKSILRDYYLGADNNAGTKALEVRKKWLN